MDCIALLSEEHRQIERVLRALDRETNLVHAGGALTVPLFEAVFDFIRNYADGAHHAKEERVLFELLHEHGLDPDAGPTRWMHAEHDVSRELVAQMALASAAAADDLPGSRDALVDAAAKYVQLMDLHIRKEDRVLFPLARRLLPEPVLSDMYDAFWAVSSTKVSDFSRAADVIDALGATRSSLPRSV
jgi:hemerythrin-like domain-containing protein